MCVVIDPSPTVMDTQPHPSGHSEASSHEEERGRERMKMEDEEIDRNRRGAVRVGPEEVPGGAAHASQ